LPSASSGKKSERDAVAEQRRAFSGVFIGVANQLLSLYLQDARKVHVLLRVLRRVELDQYSVLRKKKEFNALLGLVRDVLLKHSAEAVLEEAAAILAHLSLSEHALREEAEAAAQELATKLVDEFNALYEDVHGTQMPTRDDDERLISMSHVLRRMLSVTRAVSLPQLALDGVPNVEKSLQFYAVRHERKQEQEILIVLMQLTFAQLQSSMRTLMQQADEEAREEQTAEEEEEEKEEKSPKKSTKGKGGKRGAAAASSSAGVSHDALLSSTRRLQSVFSMQLDQVFAFTAANNAPVQEAAFRTLSDAFVLFSGKVWHEQCESNTEGGNWDWMWGSRLTVFFVTSCFVLFVCVAVRYVVGIFVHWPRRRCQVARVAEPLQCVLQACDGRTARTQGRHTQRH
jgi:hypothetical protein